MKPTKCRAKEKKRGGEKATRKSEDCSAVSQLENLDILLSAHARTSQADIILYLDRKAAKCMTCKQLLGKFLKLVIARHVQ